MQAAGTPRKAEVQLTVRRYICRACGSTGTLVSLAPAPGYACLGCVKRHGKEKLIEAVMAKDAESFITGERR